MKCEVYFILHIQTMKMEQIECSETSAYNHQTPGKYPKEYIQDSKQGESLKLRVVQYFELGRARGVAGTCKYMRRSDKKRF